MAPVLAQSWLYLGLGCFHRVPSSDEMLSMLGSSVTELTHEQGLSTGCKAYVLTSVPCGRAMSGSDLCVRYGSEPNFSVRLPRNKFFTQFRCLCTCAFVARDLRRTPVTTCRANAVIRHFHSGTSMCRLEFGQILAMCFRSWLGGVRKTRGIGLFP